MFIVYKLVKFFKILALIKKGLIKTKYNLNRFGFSS